MGAKYLRTTGRVLAPRGAFCQASIAIVSAVKLCIVACLHYLASMNAPDALSRLKAVAPALKAMGATALYLFGSTARGEAGARSDLDLFIDYDRSSRFNAFHLVGIKQFLEDELQAPIDITTRDGLHPLLRDRIERTSVQVF
jgi:uncharacterized protein